MYHKQGCHPTTTAFITAAVIIVVLPESQSSSSSFLMLPELSLAPFVLAPTPPHCLGLCHGNGPSGTLDAAVGLQFDVRYYKHDIYTMYLCAT